MFITNYSRIQRLLLIFPILAVVMTLRYTKTNAFDLYISTLTVVDVVRILFFSFVLLGVGYLLEPEGFTWINSKLDSPYVYFHPTVSVFGTIIFDNYSIFYVLTYIFAYIILSYIHIGKKVFKLSTISRFSIYVIVFLSGSYFYRNDHAIFGQEESYWIHFATLLVMHALWFICVFLYCSIYKKGIFPAHVISYFVLPTIWNVFFVYPQLAIETNLSHVNWVFLLIVFFFQYSMIKWFRKRVLNLCECHVALYIRMLNGQQQLVPKEQRVQIRLSNELPLHEKGIYDKKNRMILINGSLDYYHQIETIVHELSHYFFENPVYYRTAGLMRYVKWKWIEELLILLLETPFTIYQVIFLHDKQRVETRLKRYGIEEEERFLCPHYLKMNRTSE